MSLFNRRDNDCFGGNPLNGLCEKVCIQAKKVFDACISQDTIEDVRITVVDIDPGYTYPLTFISGRSTATRGIISNLSVDRLEERPHFARVRCDITIPIEVTFVDAEGSEGKGKSHLTVHKDIVLYVPEASIIPYTIESVVSAVLPEGIYISGAGEEATFSCDTCINVIMKVVIEVELLVPSYGYAQIPPCQEFTQEICQGFFEMPLFPNSSPRNNRE